MALRAGKLNKRVTLQRPRDADERDTHGQPVDDWPDVATVWAAVEPLSAGESQRAQQAGADLTHRVTIRYRADVLSNWRVKFDDPRRPAETRTRYLAIVGPPRDPDERGEYLELLCQERGA